MKRFRRTRFLIDRFQTRILLLHLTYFLALILIFLSSVFLPLIFRLRSSSLPFDERQAVAEQFLSLHAHLWPAVLILFLLLSIHSVFISHRIAGPLVRFRKVLAAVTGGDLSVRLTLRRKDYLVKEAAQIEEMITALRERIGEVKERSLDLRVLVDEIHAQAESASADNIRPKLERLHRATERLQASLDQFNTEAPPDHAPVALEDASPLAHSPATEA
jgi:methyl-accepting chemotaxis protein